MELNVNINEAAIVDAVVQKLMASSSFWGYLRDDLHDYLYKKVVAEFDENKIRLFDAANESISVTLRSRIRDLEDGLKTKITTAVQSADRQVAELTGKLMQKAAEHLTPKNLDHMLGGIIREMHGQQVGSLVAKSVAKMCASLNQE